MVYWSADESEKSDSEGDDLEPQEFELIGVTVHTGTAEGGHYYSFIRDKLSKNEMGQDKWSVLCRRLDRAYYISLQRNIVKL